MILRHAVRVLIVLFTNLVVILPPQALAFESQLANASKSVSNVWRVGNPGIGGVSMNRDPYLAEAINGLPDYEFTEAGNVITTNTPPKAKVVKAKLPVAQERLIPVGGALVLEGEASYYSRAGCLGCNPLMIMANGQPLDDNALTMAIGADKKHLVGHKAVVTSLVTGKSATVLITDTGGFYKDRYGNRVADLTIATKNAIGMKGGVGQVRVEVLL